MELHQKQDHLLDAKDVILSIEEKLLRFKKSISKTEPALLKRLIRNMYDVIFMKEGRLEGYYVTTNENGPNNQNLKIKKASGITSEASVRNLKNLNSAGWQVTGPKVAYCVHIETWVTLYSGHIGYTFP